MVQEQSAQCAWLERFSREVSDSAWPPAVDFSGRLYHWARSNNYDVSKEDLGAPQFIEKPTTLGQASFDECLGVVRRLSQMSPKKKDNLLPLANVAQRMMFILGGRG
ncbi:MAG: hypothetical protein ABIQ16_05080 [Polyangiaceae bacterium]